MSGCPLPDGSIRVRHQVMRLHFGAQTPKNKLRCRSTWGPIWRVQQPQLGANLLLSRGQTPSETDSGRLPCPRFFVHGLDSGSGRACSQTRRLILSASLLTAGLSDQPEERESEARIQRLGSRRDYTFVNGKVVGPRLE
jgi:hypothetical protein